MALVGFAAWLFVALPLLYLPGDWNTVDWGTVRQWLAALLAGGASIAAAVFIRRQRQIARKRVMIGAVMARDPDDAYGSPGPAGANRQIEVDALMRGSRPLLEID